MLVVGLGPRRYGVATKTVIPQVYWQNLVLIILILAIFVILKLLPEIEGFSRYTNFVIGLNHRYPTENRIWLFDYRPNKATPVIQFVHQ